MNSLTQEEIQLIEWLQYYSRINLGRVSYHTNRGVTQGGVISPMLFAIATQSLIERMNLHTEIKGRFVFYADDLCFQVEEIDTIRTIDQILKQWCHEAGMQINHRKSGIM